jgi:cobyrinic acid a,c-diamide synthase
MSLVISGERSGVGKTTVTLTLLASLRRRGLKVQSFKVGPDYIDPMFHQYVTGLPCRNLDPVITSEGYVRECFATHAQQSECALVEGVMGLFDGIRGSGEDFPANFGSTAHIARLLDLPVVLTIDCSRLSGSVAAIAYGYCNFDQNIKIAGVVLNRVGSDRHLQLLKDSLEPLQLPIIGVLRREDNITIPDRHLGLVPTAELPGLDALVERLADLGDTCFDWEKLLPILMGARSAEGRGRNKFQIPYSRYHTPHTSMKIAIARDRAFNFYYQDNLDLLQKLGAELVEWSPLSDTKLPEDVRGMYFGGGFPEVFAQQLGENTRACVAVKTAILSGMPTIAECGGLMYLCDQIVDFKGISWPMVGILPATAMMGKGLTLGYRRAVALQNSLLVDAGTTICGHEFHRSGLESPPVNPLFQTYRYDTRENTGYEGWSMPRNIHASYLHMHWGATPEIPQRFLQKCFEFKGLENQIKPLVKK